MRNLAIDTDPGVDDALAIMLAASDPDTKIRCITAVAGNVLLEHTLENALYLKELLGLADTRVAKGADRPLLLPYGRISPVHGEDGFAGYSRRPSVQADEKPAWDVLKEEAERCGGTLEILTLGPLTNIATALLRYPELKKEIRQITMMGGSTYTGNVTPVAEFNVWVDPDACDIVFRSGIPVRMCGLDGLNDSKLNEQDMQALMGHKGEVNEALAMPLLRFLYENRKGWEDVIPGIVIYDLATCACALYPEIARYKAYYVRCETKSPLNTGRTVVDLYRISGEPENVEVLQHLNKAKFTDIFENMLQYLEK
jgi:inosine-uridine nucleoside N-ribohydrolase